MLWILIATAFTAANASILRSKRQSTNYSPIELPADYKPYNHPSDVSPVSPLGLFLHNFGFGLNVNPGDRYGFKGDLSLPYIDEKTGRYYPIDIKGGFKTGPDDIQVKFGETVNPTNPFDVPIKDVYLCLLDPKYCEEPGNSKSASDPVDLNQSDRQGRPSDAFNLLENSPAGSQPNSNANPRRVNREREQKANRALLEEYTHKGTGQGHVTGFTDANDDPARFALISQDGRQLRQPTYQSYRQPDPGRPQQAGRPIPDPYDANIHRPFYLDDGAFQAMPQNNLGLSQAYPPMQMQITDPPVYYIPPPGAFPNQMAQELLHVAMNAEEADFTEHLPAPTARPRAKFGEVTKPASAEILEDSLPFKLDPRFRFKKTKTSTAEPQSSQSDGQEPPLGETTESPMDDESLEAAPLNYADIGNEDKGLDGMHSQQYSSGAYNDQYAYSDYNYDDVHGSWLPHDAFSDISDESEAKKPGVDNDSVDAPVFSHMIDSQPLTAHSKGSTMVEKVADSKAKAEGKVDFDQSDSSKSIFDAQPFVIRGLNPTTSTPVELKVETVPSADETSINAEPSAKTEPAKSTSTPDFQSHTPSRTEAPVSVPRIHDPTQALRTEFDQNTADQLFFQNGMPAESLISMPVRVPTMTITRAQDQRPPARFISIR